MLWAQIQIMWFLQEILLLERHVSESVFVMEHVGMVVIQGGYGHVRLKEGIVNMVQILNIAPQISPIHVLEPVGMDVVLEAFGLVLLKEDIVNIKSSKTFHLFDR